MKRLIQLFSKHKAFVVFGLMEAFCFWLIINFNAFQSATFFTSANNVSGGIFGVTSKIGKYFDLQDINNNLAIKNADLLQQSDSLKIALSRYNEVISTNMLLQKELILIKGDTVNKIEKIDLRLHKASNYIAAKIIKNSTTLQENYITINKGRKDGIEPDMGVLSNTGIVGRVISVSNNYALVKSLLSKDYRVAIQFAKQKTYGSLIWNNQTTEFVGKLETIPRHVNAQIGDTIVTSGYNAVFPEGTIVGTVKEATINDHQTWYDISVDLTTDFKSLYYVYVVKDPNNPERKSMEFKRQEKNER